MTGYLGCYTDRSSKGIYRFELNEKTGEMQDPQLLCHVENPIYFTHQNGLIYTLCGNKQAGGVAVFDEEGNLIDQIMSEGEVSCHIAVQGDYIYTANYHSGEVTKLKFSNNQLTVIHQITFGREAGCHQVLFLEEQILVPCLFLDRLYQLDQDLNVISYVSFEKGTGPRHGVLNGKNDRLHLVSELSNQLFLFTVNGTELSLKQTISLLPKGRERTEGTAAVRLSEDEKVLWVSTRFANIVTTFDISGDVAVPLQYRDTEGDHPRDILPIEDRFLLVANRFDQVVHLFSMKEKQIDTRCSSIAIDDAVCISL